MIDSCVYETVDRCRIQPGYLIDVIAILFSTLIYICTIVTELITQIISRLYISVPGSNQYCSTRGGGVLLKNTTVTLIWFQLTHSLTVNQSTDYKSEVLCTHFLLSFNYQLLFTFVARNTFIKPVYSELRITPFISTSNDTFIYI